jgi:hypothetical protein
MGLQVKPLEIVELHNGRQSDSGVSYTRYGNWDGTRPILEGRVPVRLLAAIDKTRARTTRQRARARFVVFRRITTTTAYSSRVTLRTLTMIVGIISTGIRAGAVDISHRHKSFIRSFNRLQYF